MWECQHRTKMVNNVNKHRCKTSAECHLYLLSCRLVVLLRRIPYFFFGILQFGKLVFTTVQHCFACYCSIHCWRAVVQMFFHQQSRHEQDWGWIGKKYFYKTEIKKGHSELSQGESHVQITSSLNAFNKMSHKLVMGSGVPHQNDRIITRRVVTLVQDESWGHRGGRSVK